MATSAPELREEIESRRQAIDRDLSELGDKVNPSKAVRRTADRTVAGGKDRLVGLKDAVMGRAELVRDRADDVGSSLGSGVGEARDGVRQRTAGSPLGAGLAAFGLGLVVAAVWPASDAERKAASAIEGAASDTVREAVRTEGEALMDELREPARDAVNALEERAADAAQSVNPGTSASGGQTQEAATPDRPA
jgi:hypothetical protein